MVEAEDIVEKCRGLIIQDDVDSIVERQFCSFVLADEGATPGFLVVPVMRSNERLMLGLDQVFPFEMESWLTNFFDGNKIRGTYYACCNSDI